MKILVVVSRSRSLLRFRGRLLQTLAAGGHEVVACGPDDEPGIREKLAGLGVRFVAVPVDRAGLNPFADLRLLIALARVMRSLEADLVLPYTIKPVIYSSLVTRLLIRRSICCSTITGLGHVFIDDSVLGRLLQLVVRPLYRFALARNPVLLFQNQDDETTFRRMRILREGQRSVVVGGSGVDLGHFRRAPVRTEKGPPVFLMMGRITRQKGIYEYREAAHILKRRHPAARVQLLGLFLAHPSAVGKDQVEEWHRSGDLEFLGSADDVRPALRNCDVYVLPSYREGKPRSVLEAMATGRAIITTDVPGCRETVIHGVNGFLVPPRDPQALAEAMARFVESPELITSMGAQSYRMACEKYAVETVNRQILGALSLGDEATPRAD